MTRKNTRRPRALVSVRIDGIRLPFPYPLPGMMIEFEWETVKNAKVKSPTKPAAKRRPK